MNDIRYELLNDEYLVWQGKPIPSLFNSSDIFMIPFSLMWGGFAIFWESMVIMMGAPFFFMLWGIPFVAIGLYIIFGRFFVRVNNLKKTTYYITNQRVIERKHGRTITTKAEFLSSIPTINSKEKNNGTGTLIFGYLPFGSGMYVNSGMEFFIRGRRYGNMPLIFQNIEDVQKVKRIIHDIRTDNYDLEY